MIIVSQSGRMVCKAEYIERYTIANKPDATLIAAGFYNQTQAATLGRYKDEEEAMAVLADLALALGGGQTIYYMPESTLYDEQEHIKDARTRRKGGS